MSEVGKGGEYELISDNADLFKVTRIKEKKEKAELTATPNSNPGLKLETPAPAGLQLTEQSSAGDLKLQSQSNPGLRMIPRQPATFVDQNLFEALVRPDQPQDKAFNMAPINRALQDEQVDLRDHIPIRTSYISSVDYQTTDSAAYTDQVVSRQEWANAKRNYEVLYYATKNQKREEAKQERLFQSREEQRREEANPKEYEDDSLARKGHATEGNELEYERVIQLADQEHMETGIRSTIENGADTVIGTIAQGGRNFSENISHIRRRLTRREVRPAAPAQTTTETPPAGMLLQRPLDMPLNTATILQPDQLRAQLEVYRINQPPELIDQMPIILSNLNTTDPEIAIRQLRVGDLLRPQDIAARAGQTGIDLERVDLLFDAVRIHHIADDIYAPIRQNRQQEVATRYPENHQAYEAVRNLVGTTETQRENIMNIYLDQFLQRMRTLRTDTTEQHQANATGTPELYYRRRAAERVVADFRPALLAITTEQFLAAMSLQETYESPRARLRKETFLWHLRNNMPRTEAPQLLQNPNQIRGVRPDLNLIAPANLAEKLTHYRNNPSEEVNRAVQELAGELQDKDPAATLSSYQIDTILSPADITAAPPAQGIDAAKIPLILDAIRINTITTEIYPAAQAAAQNTIERDFPDSQQTYTEAHDTVAHYLEGLHSGTPATDMEVENLLNNWVDDYHTLIDRIQTLPDQVQRATEQNPDNPMIYYRTTAAQLLLRRPGGRLVFRGMTPEQVLATMTIQETYQQVREDLRRQIFNRLRRDINLPEPAAPAAPPDPNLQPDDEDEEEQHTNLLKKPTRVEIDFNSVATELRMNRLLAQFEQNPPAELTQLIHDATTHMNDTPPRAIERSHLTNLVIPKDLATDENHEIEGVVDPEAEEFLVKAIRLHHIVPNVLYADVDREAERFLSTRNADSLVAFADVRGEIRKHVIAHPPADIPPTDPPDPYANFLNKKVNEEMTRYVHEFRRQLKERNAWRVTRARRSIAQGMVTQDHDVFGNTIDRNQFLAAISIEESLQNTRDEFERHLFDILRRTTPRRRTQILPDQQETRRRNRELLEEAQRVRINFADYRPRIAFQLARQRIHPTEAVERIINGINMNDNPVNVLRQASLDDVLTPEDILTDSVNEPSGGVDYDRQEFLRDGIRLNQVAVNLSPLVEESVDRNLQNTSPQSLRVYRNVQHTIREAVIREQLPTSIDIGNENEVRDYINHFPANDPEVNREVRTRLRNVWREFNRVLTTTEPGLLKKLIWPVERATPFKHRFITRGLRHQVAEAMVIDLPNELRAMSANQVLAMVSVEDMHEAGVRQLREQMFRQHKKMNPRNRQPTPPQLVEPIAAHDEDEPEDDGHDDDDDHQDGGLHESTDDPTISPSGGALQPDQEQPITTHLTEPVQPTRATGEHQDQPPVDARYALQTNEEELAPVKVSKLKRILVGLQERIQNNIRLPQEGTALELSQGLMTRSLDVAVTTDIQEAEFLDQLNEFRGEAGEQIRAMLAKQPEPGAGTTFWRLQDALNPGELQRIQNIQEVIYVREMAHQYFRENRQIALEEELERQSPLTVEAFNNIRTNARAPLHFQDIITNYDRLVHDQYTQLNKFNIQRSLRGAFNTTQTLNTARRNAAEIMFGQVQNALPEGTTREQFQAAIAMGKTLLNVEDKIFRDYFAEYIKTNPQALLKIDTHVQRLTERATRLIQKVGDAIKIDTEKAPFELSKGLLVSPIHIEDVDTERYIDDWVFYQRLDDYRGTKDRNLEGIHIRERFKTMDPAEIISEWGLQGMFNETEMLDPDMREEVLDAIYIREISREVFQQHNLDVKSRLADISDRSIHAYDKLQDIILDPDFLPVFMGRIITYENKLRTASTPLNPIEIQRAVNKERVRVAGEIYEAHKEEIVGTPAELLAAFSFAESLLEIKDEMFNDLITLEEKYKADHPQDYNNDNSDDDKDHPADDDDSNQNPDDNGPQLGPDVPPSPLSGAGIAIEENPADTDDTSANKSKGMSTENGDDDAGLEELLADFTTADLTPIPEEKK